MASQRPLAVPAQTGNRRTASYSSDVNDRYPTGVQTASGNDAGLSLPEANALGHLFDPAPDHGNDSGSFRNPRQLFSRPSPWVVYPVTILSACVFGAMMGPRTELYVKLACAYHRPEYYAVLPPPSPIFMNVTSSSHFLDVRFPAAEIWLPRAQDVRPIPAVNIPSGNTKCSSDPVVLAAVAKLVTVTTLVVGILTCITTGWWGQLSDRRGRKFVLGFTVLGILLSDMNMVLVTNLQSRLPGGYWFLVVSSVIDGLLGGMQTAGAAMHAYIADCTEPSDRARAFSMYLGFLFIGMGFGPTLGSIMIQATHDLLTPFYLAIVVHMFLSAYLWLVIPESLDPKVMEETRGERTSLLRERELAVDRAKASGTWSPWHRLHVLADIASPLAIFVPKKREPGVRGKGRDWNLTSLAIAYGIMMSFMSLAAYNTQYAVAQFGWTAVEIGYWISLIGASRAIYLILILPLVTKIFKPKPAGIALSTNGVSSPLLRSRASSPAPESRSRSPSFPVPGGTISPHVAARFDVQIAYASLLLEFVCFIVMILSVGPRSWMVGTIIASFASGFSPSVQSLALFLSAAGGDRENGKLFGSLAVVSALGSQVLGPAIFGAIYVNTVASFPKGIYVAAIVGMCIATTLVGFIRLPGPRVVLEEDVEQEGDA